MTNPKLRAYHRYRRAANAILCCAVFLLGLLLILGGLGYRHPLLSLFSYLAEAVLVASVADFIAILALTRPIPGLKFTGLIQKKRQELIDGFVQACETKILPQQAILEMVRDRSIVTLLKQNLTDATISAEAPTMGRAMAVFLRRQSSSLSMSLARRIRRQVEVLDTPHLLKTLEQVAVRRGWLGAVVRTLFNNISAEAAKETFVDELEFKIRLSVEKKRLAGGVVRRLWTSVKTWAGEKSDAINYRELAEKLAFTLRDTLIAIRAGGSDSDPWREMELFASELLGSLAENPAFLRELQDWQGEVLSEASLAPQLEKLILILAEWLEDGTLTSREINASLKFQLLNEEAADVNINRWLAAAVMTGLDALEKNDALVQAEFGKLADAFVRKEYTSILEIIRDVLSKLSDRGLVEKVHEVAGSNLQWLRISGAYIGLVTGFLLYLISTWPFYGLPVLVVATTAVLFLKPVRSRLVRICT